MYITIDRFEGDYAVCEVQIGRFVNLDRSLVPDAKEGDVIEIRIDRGKTAEQKKKIDSLVDELFRD